MVCSPELSQAAAAHLRGVAGVTAVKVLHAAFPFNGEDFALFLRRVPGAMFYLGVANTDAGLNGVPRAGLRRRRRGDRTRRPCHGWTALEPA